MLFSGKLAEMTSQGRRVEVCCRLLKFVAVCCIVLQRVAACCSLIFIGTLAEDDLHDLGDELWCVAVC